MIALYSRVSTAEQVNGYSIDEQIDRMKNYCDAMDWKDIKVYTDAGFSGANQERPSLQQMISDIKNGKIERVLVYKLDRLSRSQKDTLEIIEDVIIANGADFISMSENFDTSSPFGKAMIGILAVFAQLEREQIKERMSMGKRGRAKEGKWGGGSNVPIGYEYTDGELIINEFEAMQIREIYDLYLSGVSISRIEKIFREKGYSHKYGQWNKKRIRGALEREIYIGNIKWAGEWFAGSHEAIISHEQFDKAQEINRIRASKYKKSPRNSTFLGGLIYCKQCGARYSISNTDKYRYYICHSRRKQNLSMIKDPDCKNKIYPMHDLDRIIFDEIKKLSLDPDYLTELREESGADSNKKKIDLISSQIGKIETRRSRLIDLYALGSYSVEELQERIDPLNDQKKRLETELQSLRDHEPKLKDPTEIIGSFAEILETGSHEEIRLIIETLIDRIEIDGDDIIIYWSFV